MPNIANETMNVNKMHCAKTLCRPVTASCPGKGVSLLFLLTLPNVDQFAEFFHRRT